MISQTAEYALRAIVHLARNGSVPSTTRQISESVRVPAGYLSKVMQSLGRAGIVRSRRGLHGGFTLARTTRELTVLDVINAVDPLQRLGCCPAGIRSHRKEFCPLHRMIDAALATVEKKLGGTTVQQLVEEELEDCLFSGVEGPAQN